MNYTISFGIPTYRRNKQLFYLLDQLTELHRKCDFELIIVDDGGIENQDLDSKIETLDYPIIHIHNSKNIGYSGSLIKIFESARTDYLIMLEDDGEIIPATILEFIHQLKNNDLIFASTPFKISNNEYIRKFKKDQLSIWEFKLAAGHAPGLVYNVSKFKRVIPLIQKLNFQNTTYFGFYPQLVLFLLVYVSNETETKGFQFINSEIVKSGIEEEPSGLSDQFGEKYFHPKSRLIQQLELLHFAKIIDLEFNNSSSKLLKDALQFDYYNDFKRELKLFDETTYFQFAFKGFLLGLFSPKSVLKGFKKYLNIKKTYKIK